MSTRSMTGGANETCDQNDLGAHFNNSLFTIHFILHAVTADKFGFPPSLSLFLCIKICSLGHKADELQPQPVCFHAVRWAEMFLHGDP